MTSKIKGSRIIGHKLFFKPAFLNITLRFYWESTWIVDPVHSKRSQQKPPCIYFLQQILYICVR
jgi:hypothetical protein